MALDYGLGRIVVDNFSELELLDGIARSRGVVQDVMLRLSPGVDPHTHVHTTTGTLDSKFGFAIETGDAESAMRLSLEADGLDLVGVHMHLGSPIFELEPYAIGIDAVLTFVASLALDGFTMREFSPGGGFAVGYLPGQPAASDRRLRRGDRIGGRASVRRSGPWLAQAGGRAGPRHRRARRGRALLRGSVKDIPGVRKYVSVDGGMGDNIRPALYDAAYEAVVANRMSDPAAETVTLAGKFCESGDVLIRDIELPVLERGDLIAIPASGAYAPSMASNYNLNPRPAIVMVNDGQARLIRRRETYQDMMLCDVVD